MDGRTAAMFPFLKGSGQYASEHGPDIETMLTSSLYEPARQRGLDRVLGAIRNHTIEPVPLVGSDADWLCLNEILSYPYARILVSCVNDRLLTRRYALAEAEHMNTLLNDVKSAIPVIVSEMEINAKKGEEGIMNMHFADYLRYSYVMKATEWKLINMDIRNGYVRLTDDKFIRLLQNAYRSRLESELPLPIPDGVRALVEPETEIVTEELGKMKNRLSPTGGQEVKDEFLPPCIRTMISMAQSGQNLSHNARFALVSYFHALGMTYDQIIAVFAASPDFDESMSEYQIKHITGELTGGDGYTPPECATMMTNGICYEPDQLCEKIKHPLNYYRIKSGNRGNGPQNQS